MSSKSNFRDVLASSGPQRHRASAVCLRSATNGLEILMVRLRDRVTGREFLSPPGGGVEASESVQDCALRETYEETGYRVRVLPFDPVIVRYDFVWEGVVYDCTTAFVLVSLTDPLKSPDPVKDAEYNIGFSWSPVSQINQELDFMPAPREAVLECVRLFTTRFDR